jgi:hypothetical protein
LGAAPNIELDSLFGPGCELEAERAQGRLARVLEDDLVLRRRDLATPVAAPSRDREHTCDGEPWHQYQL